MGDWRLLQLFMSQGAEPKVFEVSFLPGSQPRRFRCTCPGYRLRARCRHVAYIAAEVVDHGGYTPALARPDALGQLTAEVKEDAEKFRAWIYSYANILVLDAEGRVVEAPKASVP
jgi:hypothetical protein